jgi:hypothetical protein
MKLANAYLTAGCAADPDHLHTPPVFILQAVALHLLSALVSVDPASTKLANPHLTACCTATPIHSCCFHSSCRLLHCTCCQRLFQPTRHQQSLASTKLADALHRNNMLLCLTTCTPLLFILLFFLQAVALHLLSALVSADPASTKLADALHRNNVPRGLLQSVAEHAPHILLQPAHKAQVWDSHNDYVTMIPRIMSLHGSKSCMRHRSCCSRHTRHRCATALKLMTKFTSVAHYLFVTCFAACASQELLQLCSLCLQERWF